MGLPVVHFEIIGTDPAGLRGYYGALFDWEFQTGDATTEKVSQPGTYGFVNEASAGINGGIGGGQGHEPRVLFYVGVPDVEAALRKARASAASVCSGPSRLGGLHGRPVRRPRGERGRRSGSVGVKYLLLIYSNPANWEHPLFLRNPEFLAMPAAEREELTRRSEALHREISESGELLVAAALADPVNTRSVRVRDGVPATTDGPYVETKEQLAGYLWSTARAWSGRTRSRRPFPTRGSVRWRCIRSWTCRARRCERAGGPAAPAGAAGPRRARAALRQLRDRRGRGPGGAARRRDAVARRGARQPRGMADHGRLPPDDRPAPQRTVRAAARGDGRRADPADRLVAPPPTPRSRGTTRSSCCRCAAIRASPRPRRSR